MATILVIEDEENIRFSVCRALKKRGHVVSEAGSAGDAAAALEETAFDLIISDINLPDGDGIEIAKRLREEGYDGAIVMVTAFGTVESAVEAMKSGADDYLQKPVSLDELMLLADRVLDQRSVRRRLALYERQDPARSPSDRPLGESDEWLRTLSMAERIARVPIGQTGDESPLPCVLLLGETGAGKGVMARHVHRAGEADDDTKPFVHVNCSSLPAQLVESELFGHEKGAFTDARDAREGLVEMADGGTLFLDEIGDMPLELQSKILIFLESGRFRRVGGSRERAVRCRVIAATNHDLEAEAERKEFRADLLYRLGVFPIHVPSLRSRGRDAVLIAREAFARFRQEYSMPQARFTEDAEEALRSHAWPGNVRQLINTVQRAAMLCDGPEITPSDLGLGEISAPVSGPASAGGKPGELIFDFDSGIHLADEVEKELMVQAIRKTGGNVSQACRLIGMQRSSFRYRVDRYGLDELIRELSSR